MSPVRISILSAYPSVEEIARHVSAIRVRVGLVISRVCETFPGAEVYVEGRAGLEFFSNIRSAVRRIDGPIELHWPVESGLCRWSGAGHRRLTGRSSPYGGDSAGAGDLTRGRLLC